MTLGEFYEASYKEFQKPSKMRDHFTSAALSGAALGGLGTRRAGDVMKPLIKGRGWKGAAIGAGAGLAAMGAVYTVNQVKKAFEKHFGREPAKKELDEKVSKLAARGHTVKGHPKGQPVQPKPQPGGQPQLGGTHGPDEKMVFGQWRKRKNIGAGIK